VSDNVHHLKVWPRLFEGLLDGTKTAEVRNTRDRYFDVDDTLVLEEWDPATASYTGHRVTRRISQVDLLGELRPELNGLVLLSFYHAGWVVTPDEV
jgi:hypothetical protein